MTYEQKKPNSQWLTSTLLLNASFIDNLGLMHGKMGIAIYFFYLARQAQNPIYEDYAGELLDEIYNEISASTSFDFENGLTGIGWGIEHLVQNGFIDADTDEVLEEFDNQLTKQSIYAPPESLGLAKGLAGLGAYFLKRLQNQQANDEKISTLTNKQTLIHLIDELDRRLTTDEIEKLLNGKMEKLFSSETATSLNLQNTSPPNNLVQPETGPAFDLLWDYPVLLWFLAELHKQDIFNFKVEKLILKLAYPLLSDTYCPKRICNRLLVGLAMHQVANCLIENGADDAATAHAVSAKASRLLAGIARNGLCKELPENNSSLRHGTAGAAWVYGQLFQLTQNETYREEADYWQAKSLENSSSDKGAEGFALKNGNNAFGLLEGLAGISLFDYLIKKYNNITI